MAPACSLALHNRVSSLASSPTLNIFKMLTNKRGHMLSQQAGGGMPARHQIVEEPTRSGLVALIDADITPAHLTMVENASGTRFLLVSQVLKLLVKDTISRSGLHRAMQASAGRRDPLKLVGIMLRKKLVGLGAISSRGPGQLLVTLSCLHKALRTKQLPAPMLDSLARLHSGIATVQDEAASALMLQNAVGCTSPSSLPFAEHLPHSVDTSNVPFLGIRQKYSLEVIRPSLAQSAVLSMQLKELQSHSQVAIVIGRDPGPISSETFGDIRKQCMLFLGFIHMHYGVAHPNLMHFVRADWLASYCGAKGARGDRGISICKVLSAAKRVVLFWRDKCQADASRLTDLHGWLGDLSSQVRRAWPSPKRNVVDMVQAGTWADAATIVSILVQQKSEVEAAFCHLETLSLEQARRLHDVALACCMFGWLPPPRSSTIRTLCNTRHRGPCPHIDCKSDRCWGNRIYVRDASVLMMEVPHHKSDKTWGTLLFALPADLSALLAMYMNKGYPVLRRELELDHPYAFMSMTGMAFESGTFSAYFKKLMLGVGGPAIAPHSLRHIFVIDQMDHAQHRGAAFCMGHDLSQWDRSYDLLALQRRGQQAIDGMQAWRVALLARVGVVAPAPSTPHDLLSAAEPHSPSEASWQSCSSTSVSSLGVGTVESSGLDDAAEDELELEIDE